MINENFVYVGILIGFTGGVSYLIDTLRGKVRPNKVTWFLWALAPLTAFFAQVQQGVGIQALLSFSVGFMPLCIFIASFFNRKSQWKITKFDILCGLLSLMGLALWGLTKEPNLAIIFAILSDALAAIPTILKSWKEPESENAFAFFTAMINAGITLLTIRKWNFATFAFPLYIFLVCVLFTSLIQFKLGKRITRKS